MPRTTPAKTRRAEDFRPGLNHRPGIQGSSFVVRQGEGGGNDKRQEKEVHGFWRGRGEEGLRAFEEARRLVIWRRQGALAIPQEEQRRGGAAGKRTGKRRRPPPTR